MSSRAHIGRLVLQATATGPAAKPLTREECDILAREILRLQEVIAEVQAWIVCAAIATPEDMMQSAPRIAEITSPGYIPS